MRRVEDVKEVFAFQLPPLAVIQKNKQAGEEDAQGRLISRRAHICQQKHKHLINPVFTANIKGHDVQDSLHPIVAVNQLRNQCKPGNTQDLQHGCTYLICPRL